jgi:hypothetical protein
MRRTTDQNVVTNLRLNAEAKSLSGSSAGPASDKFEGNIERIAFRVELITQDNGKESLRWHGTNNGEAIEYDSEPYVGRGTRLAVWFIRWLPVDWLL